MPGTPTPAFLKKSLKTVCVNTVLFFAIFALVGHITINFWERYTIQSELSTMKHSLHSLKDTLSNIGKAYDSLQTELKSLFYVVETKTTNNKQINTPPIPREKAEASYEAENIFDRKLCDIQVQTVLTKTNKRNVNKLINKNVGVETESNKQLCGCERQATGPLSDATTNTRNPLKSTGTTPDISMYSKGQYSRNVSTSIHPYHNHNCLRCH